MALGDPYVDLPYMKAYTNIPTTNEKLDAILESAIQSASDEIEQFCGRQFNKATAATPRVYTPVTQRMVLVDDFWTTEGLIIEVDDHGDRSYTTVLAPTDYELHPVNGVVGGQVGWPFNTIKMIDSVWLGRGYPSIRVTAKWGWASVPDSVKQATLLLANEAFAAKGAPLGVAGYGNFGEIRIRENPLARSKLRRFVRTPLLVG